MRRFLLEALLPLCLFALLSACTGSVMGEGKVNVRIVHDQPLMSTGLQTQSAGDKVTGLSDAFCYALMVSSSDGNPQLDRGELSKEEDNTAPGCEYNPRSLGKVNGLYKIGDTAEISVPVGESRQFYLFGIQKTDLMKSCSAALTLEPNTGEGENNVDAKLDGTVVKKFKPLLMAYAKANVGRTASTVDLRMVSDAAGLDIDKCGNDKLETTPSLYSFGDGTLPKLDISKGLTQPFIQIHCPSTAAKASVGAVNAAAAATQLCAGNPIFILDPNVQKWELKLYDSSGQQISFNHEVYDQSGTGPDRSIAFQIPVATDRYPPFATLTDGTNEISACYTDSEKDCKIVLADSKQIVMAIQDSGLLLKRFTFGTDSGNLKPILAADVQSSLADGMFNTVGYAIPTKAGNLVPFSFYSGGHFTQSFFSLTDSLQGNSFSTSIPFPGAVTSTEKFSNFIVSAASSAVSIMDGSDTVGTSAVRLNYGSNSIASNSYSSNLKLSENLLTNRYHIARRLYDGTYSLSECITGTKCLGDPTLPQKTALLGFDTSPDSAFTTYQDENGGDRFITILNPDEASVANSNVPQILDLPLESFHYLTNVLPSANTDTLDLSLPFSEDFGTIKKARSSKFFTVSTTGWTRSFSFLTELKNSENNPGHFLAGGFAEFLGDSYSLIMRSPDWGKTWFETYRSSTPNTKIIQAVQIPLPGQSGSEQQGFLIVEKNTSTQATRLLLQQGGDGF